MRKKLRSSVNFSLTVLKSPALSRMRSDGFSVSKAHGRYVEFAKSTVKYQDLAGLKVVLDCANGAAYAVAPKIFGELGVDLTVIFDQPNGRNINSGCGATHVEALAEEVLACGADIGIALDGDADRIIVVTRTVLWLMAIRSFVLLLCG